MDFGGESYTIKSRRRQSAVYVSPDLKMKAICVPRERELACAGRVLSNKIVHEPDLPKRRTLRIPTNGTLTVCGGLSICLGTRELRDDTKNALRLSGNLKGDQRPFELQ